MIQGKNLYFNLQHYNLYKTIRIQCQYGFYYFLIMLNSSLLHQNIVFLRCLLSYLFYENYDWFGVRTVIMLYLKLSNLALAYTYI